MLWTIGKLREFPTMMVFGTFEVSANPRPESYVPFSRCSAQKQKSAAKSIFRSM
jgi:hypothetical protein